MPQPSIAQIVRDLSRIKSKARIAAIIVRLVRSVLLALMTISIWALICPEEELAQLGLGLLTLVLAWSFPLDRYGRRQIDPKDFALNLEMKFGRDISVPLSTVNLEAPLPEAWLGPVETEKQGLLRFERKRLFGLFSSLLIPLLSISILSVTSGVPSFKIAMNEVKGVVSRLARGASLRVLAGATSANNDPSQSFSLTQDNPPTVELLAENLVEIQVTDGSSRSAAPVVLLKKVAAKSGGQKVPIAEETTDAPSETDIYQSFQLLPVRDDVSDGEALGRYRIAFAVNESVQLYIPSFAGDRPLGTLNVRQAPVPKVRIETVGSIEEPWPDDQPIPLRIHVKAENPIQTVRLIIKSGQRLAKELVANVVSEDKTELTTDYRLILETYVESDLAQVEIVAEAVDRAVPTPLVGYSEPLKLSTASAYGRYRETLSTLRSLKTLIDDTLSKSDTSLPDEAKKLATKATIQSEKSPFFDGLDRVQIYRFAATIEDYFTSNSSEKLMEISESLNDFLFEHEILDDRERDRDFFVAMRSLSRLIEQEASKRPIPVSTVTDRTRKFLDDRLFRWTKRIERLGPNNGPEKWPSIRDQKPFHQAMFTVDKLEASNKPTLDRTSDMLTVLSKTTVEYRSWIEELEAREDKVREAEEQARQEGLANARDVLRELQQRQGEVSQGLDRAGERPRGQLADEWPGLRMKQNTNIRDTRRLEGQMRALSPTSAARIGGALEAMDETMKQGDGEDFQVAESASDMAGRLLRQAESAAQDSQQKRRSRGRRRHVTGDNYYGQSVVGGDIEIRREYQVDRRYREDILEEVQSSQYDEENRALLENYLRHVVR